MRKLGTILYNNRYLIGIIFFAVLTFFIIISALNGIMNNNFEADSKTARELAKVENDKMEVHTYQIIVKKKYLEIMQITSYNTMFLYMFQKKE